MQKNEYIDRYDRVLNDLRSEYVNLLSLSDNIVLTELECLPQVAKERRKVLSLSQLALAELTGLAIRTIIKFEQGDDGISLRNVKAICDGLGIKLCLKS